MKTFVCVLALMSCKKEPCRPIKRPTITWGSTNSKMEGTWSPATELPPAGVRDGGVTTSLHPLPLSLEPCIITWTLTNTNNWHVSLQPNNCKTANVPLEIETNLTFKIDLLLFYKYDQWVYTVSVIRSTTQNRVIVCCKPQRENLYNLAN